MKFVASQVRKWARDIPPHPQRTRYLENLKKGLSLMMIVSHTERVTWHALYYEKGQPRTHTLGTYPELGLEEARKAAHDFNQTKAIAAAKSGTFKEIAEKWVINYVDKKRLRSKRELVRQLETYVYPRFGDENIYNVGRGMVIRLLEDIENKRVRYLGRGRRFVGGPVQANAVLATVRSVMQWYAAKQDEDYRSPIVPKMKVEVDQKRRERNLTPAEIKLVWAACDQMDTFGGLVRFLLLTGQRRGVTVRMQWVDLKDDVWTIPDTDREKGHIGRVKLPALATDVIGKLPKLDGNPFVFAAPFRKTHFNSFSQRKGELDKLLPKMERWTLHDLRRTARTLMEEIGIQGHISERTLGHKIKGVEGVYNQYGYLKEKSEALQRLATKIGLIVAPPDKTNVAPFRRKTRSKIKTTTPRTSLNTRAVV